jgi:hypothetical protein
MHRMKVLICCVKVSCVEIIGNMQCIKFHEKNELSSFGFHLFHHVERISANVLGLDITWVILIAVSTVLFICSSFVATTIYLCRKTNNYSDNRAQCMLLEN